MKANGKRPKGVSFLGWLNALGGVVFLLASFAPNAGQKAVGFFVAGTFGIAIGIGLLRGCRWAWGFAVMSYALNIAGSLVKFNPIALVVSGLILVYLCSSKVRSAFEKHSSPVLQTAQVQQDVNQTMVL